MRMHERSHVANFLATSCRRLTKMRDSSNRTAFWRYHKHLANLMAVISRYNNIQNVGTSIKLVISDVGEITYSPLNEVLLGHAIHKEGNALFNDALSTFYLRLYGIRYIVNDH